MSGQANGSEADPYWKPWMYMQHQVQAGRLRKRSWVNCGCTRSKVPTPRGVGMKRQKLVQTGCSLIAEGPSMTGCELVRSIVKIRTKRMLIDLVQPMRGKLNGIPPGTYRVLRCINPF